MKKSGKAKVDSKEKETQKWVLAQWERMYEGGKVVDMIAGGERVDKEVEILAYEESYRIGANGSNFDKPIEEKKEPIKKRVRV